MHLLLPLHHAIENTYKDASITFYHMVLVIIHAFAISYAIFMYIGSTGDNVAGIQRRRGRGSAGEFSRRSSWKRGADSRRASWVPWSPPHLLSQRQAPEHSKSPSVLQNITWLLFLIDALGYKSWLETIDVWTYLVQIYTSFTLCRSRIENLLSHAWTGRSQVISCHKI